LLAQLCCIGIGIGIGTPSKNNLVFEPAAVRSRQTGTGDAGVPNGATAR